ncbi:MCE family protein [Mycobacterium colombiense]|uniref:MCE family protein n=1 Tax=Mycobacterium colombiense TaxID=339268 RepID=UPI00200B5D4B|nr:MlaD family protein [Mycobacterium colombiense]MCK8647101.1 MCE family protein [Mycobacterium colombiense]
MRLNRRIRIQLFFFVIVALGACAVLGIGYLDAPATWFGVGRYTVTLELPEAAGLYKTGNVLYRGTEVGRIQDVRLTNVGVSAVLSLRSDIPIPADLNAAVHSVTAVGEQYVELTPRSDSALLREGDVISRDRSSVPPDVNALLESTNRGLQAIPHDNLATVVDESYRAFGGLGPELSRIVDGSTRLAIDSRRNLEPLVNLINGSAPVLDTQVDTADDIQAWAAHVANITSQLQTHDAALAGVLQKASSAADEGRALFERVRPTLPLLLANLVTVGQIAITYQPALEQLLVLLPPFVSGAQAGITADKDIKSQYRGVFLNLGLNVNLPPPCVTGFLPAQQKRTPSLEDSPDRPIGDLYCRVPQDSPFNARGARNFPCLSVPGKRAPTVKMCDSNEQYVPLNNGYNWKGDPNATLSGQDIPQLPPGSAPAQNPPPQASAPPPIAAAQYDPATGNYVGPDGRLYSQSDLSHPAAGQRTWQSLLVPPGAN